jgi:hypothetical protein
LVRTVAEGGAAAMPACRGRPRGGSGEQARLLARPRVSLNTAPPVSLGKRRWARASFNGFFHVCVPNTLAAAGG